MPLTIVLFFKTAASVDPTSFVLSFCEDIAANPGRKRAHAVKRLTPMTLMGKATESGIDDLAKTVLAPHFHNEGVERQKVC
jgi:tRNA acetyltransferase TAN1